MTSMILAFMEPAARNAGLMPVSFPYPPVKLHLGSICKVTAGLQFFFFCLVPFLLRLPRLFLVLCLGERHRAGQSTDLLPHLSRDVLIAALFADFWLHQNSVNQTATSKTGLLASKTALAKPNGVALRMFARSSPGAWWWI